MSPLPQGLFNLKLITSQKEKIMKVSTTNALALNMLLAGFTNFIAGKSQIGKHGYKTFKWSLPSQRIVHICGKVNIENDGLRDFESRMEMKALPDGSVLPAVMHFHVFPQKKNDEKCISYHFVTYFCDYEPDGLTFRFSIPCW